MSTVWEIKAYSDGTEILKEVGLMGRFLFDVQERPGLGIDAARVRATMAAAPELRDALEDLLIFHSPTHPRHEALHEEYAESCIANEISFSAATMLDDLVRAAASALAKVEGH